MGIIDWFMYDEELDENSEYGDDESTWDGQSATGAKEPLHDGEILLPKGKTWEELDEHARMIQRSFRGYMVRCRLYRVPVALVEREVKRLDKMEKGFNKLFFYLLMMYAFAETTLLRANTRFSNAMFASLNEFVRGVEFAPPGTTDGKNYADVQNTGDYALWIEEFLNTAYDGTQAPSKCNECEVLGVPRQLLLNYCNTSSSSVNDDWEPSLLSDLGWAWNYTADTEDNGLWDFSSNPVLSNMTAEEIDGAYATLFALCPGRDACESAVNGLCVDEPVCYDGSCDDFDVEAFASTPDNFQVYGRIIDEPDFNCSTMIEERGRTLNSARVTGGESIFRGFDRGSGELSNHNYLLSSIITVRNQEAGVCDLPDYVSDFGEQCLSNTITGSRPNDDGSFPGLCFPPFYGDPDDQLWYVPCLPYKGNPVNAHVGVIDLGGTYDIGYLVTACMLRQYLDANFLGRTTSETSVQVLVFNPHDGGRYALLVVKFAFDVAGRVKRTLTIDVLEVHDEDSDSLRVTLVATAFTLMYVTFLFFDVVSVLRGLRRYKTQVLEARLKDAQLFCKVSSTMRQVKGLSVKHLGISSRIGGSSRPESLSKHQRRASSSQKYVLEQGSFAGLTQHLNPEDERKTSQKDVKWRKDNFLRWNVPLRVIWHLIFFANIMVWVWVFMFVRERLSDTLTAVTELDLREDDLAVLNAVFLSIKDITTYRDINDIYIMCVYAAVVVGLLRLLDILRFHKRLSLISATLAAAFWNLVHFGIIYALILAAFAFLATMTLGTTLDSFQSISTSMVSFIRISLGDFEGYYASIIDDGPAASNAGLSGIGLVILFQLTVGILLFNLLIAICLTAFEQTQRQNSGEENVVQSLAFYTQRKVLRLINSVSFFFCTTLRLGKGNDDDDVAYLMENERFHYAHRLKQQERQPQKEDKYGKGLPAAKFTAPNSLRNVSGHRQRRYGGAAAKVGGNALGDPDPTEFDRVEAPPGGGVAADGQWTDQASTQSIKNLRARLKTEAVQKKLRRMKPLTTLQRLRLIKKRGMPGHEGKFVHLKEARKMLRMTPAPHGTVENILAKVIFERTWGSLARATRRDL